MLIQFTSQPEPEFSPRRHREHGEGQSGCLCSDRFLELQVQPQARHGHWAADLVIARVVDVLKVKGDEDTSPDMGRVERFLDGLAAVGQSAISQNETPDHRWPDTPDGPSRCRWRRTPHRCGRDCGASVCLSRTRPPPPLRCLRCRQRTRAGLRSIPSVRRPKCRSRLPARN